MHPAIRDLLERQVGGGFQDVRGATATLTLPIADRLVNEAIATFLPEGGKVREVLVESHDGNRFTARIRTGSNLLPPVAVGLEIDRQPSLPEDATLGLKLAQASKFVTLAAAALPGMVKLPPGITITGDRIGVDFKRLLVERQLDSWLAYVTDVRVETREGAVVLHVRAEIP